MVAVKAIIINAKGEVLLLKRSANDNIDANLWDIPGGRVGANEVKEAALLREVREETCLDITILSLHSHWEYTASEHVSIEGFTYLCELLEDASVILSPEHSKYEWVCPNAVYLYEMNESLCKEVQALA